MQVGVAAIGQHPVARGRPGPTLLEAYDFTWSHRHPINRTVGHQTPPKCTRKCPRPPPRGYSKSIFCLGILNFRQKNREKHNFCTSARFWDHFPALRAPSIPLKIATWQKNVWCLRAQVQTLSPKLCKSALQKSPTDEKVNKIVGLAATIYPHILFF